MLTLDNLTCVRGSRMLFRGLGLTIGDGAFVVVKGANGSGKSSLLRMIACLLEPTAGRIVYANEDVRGEHFEEYCDIIHYMGHQSALKQTLTVYENIIFWARLRENEALIPAALNYFNLTAYRDVPLYQLSAGQKQAVMLVRVMVANSDIWLLDEPLSHLDEAMCIKLVALLETRCAQGGSVIMTTHTDIAIEGKQELCLGDWK